MKLLCYLELEEIIHFQTDHGVLRVEVVLSLAAFIIHVGEHTESPTAADIPG